MSGVDKSWSLRAASRASAADRLAVAELILKLPSFNQNKRSASTPASGASKPKKPRPGMRLVLGGVDAPTDLRGPAVPPPTIQHAQAHLTSHPLSKTLSAPIPSAPAPQKTQQATSAAPPISATMVSRPSLPTVPPPKPSNPNDRPDSDSSADEDSADEKPPRQPIAPRAPGPTKMPNKSLPFGRTKHPLARGKTWPLFSAFRR